MSKAKLDKLMAKINKKYGNDENSGIVTTASQAQHLKIERIPTGIFSLDLALNGGIPKNRLVRFLGGYSGGKTTASLKLVAQAQKQDPEFQTLWLDAEHAWDPEWAQKMGVDLDRVTLVQPQSAEDAIDISKVILGEALVDLMVVDSLAHLVPMKELETSAEDQQMGLAARLINKAIRNWVSFLSASVVAKRPLTIVLINQLRDTMDPYSPQVTPGGKGQEYGSSVDIQFHRKKVVTSTGYTKGLSALAPDQGDPVASITNFLVTKNKTGPAQRAGEYTFWFQDNDDRSVGDVDCSQTLMRWAIQTGALKKEGGKYIVLSTGEEVASNKEQVGQAISTNRDLYDKLSEDVLNLVSSDPTINV